MLRASLIALALAAPLGLAACGDDDNDTANSRPAAAAAAPDPERYCALTRELDADGEKFFSGLGEDATPQQYEDAEAKFITQSKPKLDELRRVAPGEIASDVDKLLAGMQVRAGLKPALQVTEAESSAAEKRIQAFEKRNCS